MVEFLQKYSGLFIYPFVSLFISAILTFVCIRIMPKLGYIDKPGGRHIHQRMIPRGGGIAIVVSFFIALGLAILNSKVNSDSGMTLFWQLLCPAVPICILGMVDDRYELKSWIKLAVQVLVVVVIWMNSSRHNYVILGWVLPWQLSLFLSILWVVVIINAFNLIDGLDGLASGLAIVSSTCMAIWFMLVNRHQYGALTMLILAGACLGFLCYNFHPAKIFLGDTGSMFLGLIFAVMGLSTIGGAVTATSLMLPVLAIGVPIFDVFLAIWRRSTRKLLDPDAGGIMEGDQDHLHHRLFRQTRKQTTTAIAMYLIGCGFAAIALMVIFLRDSAPAVAYIILLIAVLIVIRQLAVVEIFDSAKLIQYGLAKPRHGILVNIFHPFIDFAVIGCSLGVVCWLELWSFHDLSIFIYAFAPVALLLILAQVYKVYWLRAGLNNYWNLGLVVFIGSLVSCLTVYFLFRREAVDESASGNWLELFLSGCLIFTLLNISLICMERFLVHYGQGFWIRNFYLQYQDCNSRDRVLIYGGGLSCRLYVNYLYCLQKREKQEEIVGIIDDNDALHGLWVYGFKVLGAPGQIGEIYASHPFDKIIITTLVDNADNIEQLKTFCRERGVGLARINIGIENIVAGAVVRESDGREFGTDWVPECENITPMSS